MKTPKTKKQFIKIVTEEAKNSDWDDLAYLIMTIEHAILQEDDPKVLELLNIRLEICEEEKLNRVVDQFDMEYFMNKDFPDMEDDDFEY